ncbi:TetR/AcrR family transcriptional regulator [Salinibacterium sp. NK8237]|uniref:TetR/AcrR family transcriptional regulator n=1 Tax=Salinibacterium sp. NK8237 TaxID=2792038 RepID=UPI0018CCBD52|nr:TetR family transcriptional regulator [Salinibacterium sp. NK8237]MBH0131636.1 TetR family transcriptional regulator [Salinibacterium sp. NK8237]
MSNDGVRSVKQARSIERREAILSAAVTMFMRERVSAITHRSVAAAANVPLGAIRYYFSSREELLLETLTRVEQRRHDEATRILTRASPASSIHDCAELLLRAYVGPPSGSHKLDDHHLITTVGWLVDVPRESAALSARLLENWQPISADLRAILYRCDRVMPVNLVTHVIDGAIVVNFSWERGELVSRVLDAVSQQLEFAQARGLHLPKPD